MQLPFTGMRGLPRKTSRANLVVLGLSFANGVLCANPSSRHRLEHTSHNER